MQPLADLMREVLRGDRRIAVLGEEHYGWWTGRIPGKRQLFLCYDRVASEVRRPSRERQRLLFGGAEILTNPSRPTLVGFDDPGAPAVRLVLAIFDSRGGLREVHAVADPLVDDPARGDPFDHCPPLDFERMEAFLRDRFGGFKRGVIRVRPFEIPETGLRLSPLRSWDLRFLENPEEYGEEDRRMIREWIDERCSELLYGNDYHLDAGGFCTSS